MSYVHHCCDQHREGNSRCGDPGQKSDDQSHSPKKFRGRGTETPEGRSEIYSHIFHCSTDHRPFFRPIHDLRIAMYDKAGADNQAQNENSSIGKSSRKHHLQETFIVAFHGKPPVSSIVRL